MDSLGSGGIALFLLVGVAQLLAIASIVVSFVTRSRTLRLAFGVPSLGFGIVIAALAVYSLASALGAPPSPTDDPMDGFSFVLAMAALPLLGGIFGTWRGMASRNGVAQPTPVVVPQA